MIPAPVSYAALEHKGKDPHTGVLPFVFACLFGYSSPSIVCSWARETLSR